MVATMLEWNKMLKQVFNELARLGSNNNVFGNSCAFPGVVVPV